MIRISSIFISIGIFTLLLGCANCKYPIYVGISAANPGDEVKMLFDDVQIYEGKFSSAFTWDNNDMPKITTNYCSKDSVIKVELRLLNTNQDTIFSINTHEVKGFYFSTATAGKGKYILFRDYHVGGLRGVISTD